MNMKISHCKLKRLDFSEFKYFRINHSTSFAKGKNHINGIENFWNQAKCVLRNNLESCVLAVLFKPYPLQPLILFPCIYTKPIRELKDEFFFQKSKSKFPNRDQEINDKKLL